MPTHAPRIALHDACFRHSPQRHTLILLPQQTQMVSLAASMDDQRPQQLALAVPAALRCALPLDVDCGSQHAIQALLAAAVRRGHWSFRHSCRRPDGDFCMQESPTGSVGLLAHSRGRGVSGATHGAIAYPVFMDARVRGGEAL
jgi:hypothetical protein